MKLADPNKPFIPKKPRIFKATRGNVPYYTEECADSLWSSIKRWRENNYKRTAWKLEPWEKENTLRMRLYNSLRWLKDNGTDEQQAACEFVTFTKLGDEYVLTMRRPPRERLSAARQTDHASPTMPGADKAAFTAVLNDVIRFVTSEVATDDNPRRPALEIVGVHITAEHKAELEGIIEAAGAFAHAIKDGPRGSVRIVALSPSEVAGMQHLAQLQQR